MRQLSLATLFLALSSLAAAAADITVYSPGIVNGPLRKLADAWTAETGNKVLKAQHPEFEVWSQGVHSRAGVACADCPMPYERVGATKVSDHWVRSPLINLNRACQTCHAVPEKELEARVLNIQDRHHALMQRAARATTDMLDAIVAAKKRGTAERDLQAAAVQHRKAQWRLDFVAAENSMGFHAPQELARILGEVIDHARQGQLEAERASRKP